MGKYDAKYVGVAGATPSGWDKFGSVSVNSTGTSSNPSGFIPGILNSYDSSGYVIVSDTTTAGLVGRSTGGGTGTASANTPTWWVTSAKTDESFLNLVKRLTGSQSISTSSSAKTLLNNSGYWTSYMTGVITSGLLLNLDAGDISSYPGSGTAWSDISGNGNNGNLVNGVGFSSNDNGSLLFDGVDDFVSLSDSITFINSSSPFTISLWVYYSSWPYQYSDILFLKTNTGYSLQIGASTNPGYNAIGFGSYTGWIQHHTNTGYSYFLNKWSNIVLTYNGLGSTSTSNFKPYIDSSLKTLTSQGGYATTPNINRIGYNYSNGKFNGKISNIQIYDRELSSTEVSQNYDSLKSRFGL